MYIRETGVYVVDKFHYLRNWGQVNHGKCGVYTQEAGVHVAGKLIGFSTLVSGVWTTGRN